MHTRITRQERDGAVSGADPVALLVMMQELDFHLRHVDAGRAFSLAALHDTQSAIVSRIASEVSASGPSWPDRASAMCWPGRVSDALVPVAR